MLDGTSDVVCDNQGAVNSTRLHQYTLDKKHNEINYHVVHEEATAGILCVVKEDTETNLTDLLTNILVWKRLHKIIMFILYSG